MVKGRDMETKPGPTFLFRDQALSANTGVSVPLKSECKLANRNQTTGQHEPWAELRAGVIVAWTCFTLLVLTETRQFKAGTRHTFWVNPFLGSPWASYEQIPSYVLETLAQ